jgi:replicative DNA helicase
LTGAFNIEFEDDVLAQCLRDSDYLKGAIGIVEGHHFGTDHRGWVWEVIKDVWVGSAELLTRKVAQQRVRADFRDEEERVAVYELMGKLFKLKPESPRAALSELSKFARFARLQSGMEDAVRRLDKGDVDEAYKTVTRVIAEDRMDTDNIQVVRWIEEFDQRLIHQKRIKDHPELYPAIRTGIKGLDNVIDGIRPTEMGIVAATTGRGKSIMGCHLGFHAINQDCGVIDFRTEMSASQVSMRYDSRWTRMVHSKFKRFDFTVDEIKAIKERLRKARARYDGLLRIVSIPVTTATLPKIKRTVDELRDEMRNVKMIILDSADHIRGDERYRDFRFETAGVYWDIAGWAVEDELPIWCTTQLGKQAADRIGKTEDAAEAYDKGRICDTFITINQPVHKSRATPKVEIGDDNDTEGDRARVQKLSVSGSDLVLFLSKYRDGVANLAIPLTTDLKRMLIQDRGDD